MWKMIQNQMQWEKDTRKLLRDDLIIFLFVFLLLIGTPLLTIPFDLFEEGIDYQIVLIMGVLCFIAFDQWNAPLFRVKENGKFGNVFSKYRYIPVDIRVMISAKLILVWKEIIILMAFLCGINWGSRILYGGSLLVYYAWIPCGVFLVIGLIESLQILIFYMFSRNEH